MDVKKYDGRVFGGSNEEIEEIAAKVRRRVLPDEASDKAPETRELLESLVRRTRGEIRVVDDPSVQEYRGGSLVIDADDHYTIFLSPYTFRLRDHFTIAHELGHLFLHYHLQSPKPPLPVGFTRHGSDVYEWQANRFAGALLMPREMFESRYKAFNGDPYRLSGWFEVSKPAIEVRANSLNLGRASASAQAGTDIR